MTDWCKINAPTLLTLDNKAFDAFVKASGQTPPGVTFVVEPKATIARDLSDLQGPLP